MSISRGHPHPIQMQCWVQVSYVLTKCALSKTVVTFTLVGNCTGAKGAGVLARVVIGNQSEPQAVSVCFHHLFWGVNKHVHTLYE